MREIFRHAFVYGLAPVLQKTASLVLLPLYTHHLTPTDYGQIEMLVVITGAITVLAQMEFRQGFMRAFIKADRPEPKRQVFSGSLLLLGLTAGLGTLLLICALPLLGPLLLEQALTPLFIAVLACGLFADIVNVVLRSTAQAELWSTRSVSIGFTAFLAGVGVTVYAVVFLEMGPLGFFLGSTLGSLVSFAGFAWACRGFAGRPRAAAATLQPIVRYSLPLLGGAVLYFVLRYVDRLLITEMISLAAVGLYAMTWKLAGLLITFLLIPFQRSFDAWRFKLYEQGDQAPLMARTFHVFMTAVSLAAVALCTVVADLFIAVVAPEFREAVSYIPFLACAVFLQAGFAVISSAFYVAGKTRIWLHLFAGAAAVQVAAMLILLPTLGLQGAPLATLMAYAALYAGAARWGQAYWPIPYRHLPVAVMALAICAIAFAHQAYAPPAMELRFLFDAGLVLGYVALLFAARFVTLREATAMFAWATRRADLPRAAG